MTCSNLCHLLVLDAEIEILQELADEGVVCPKYIRNKNGQLYTCASDGYQGTPTKLPFFILVLLKLGVAITANVHADQYTKSQVGALLKLFKANCS